MIRVAFVITVDEMRPNFSQIACFDRLTAHHTDGSQAGLPAIHQNESHVPPPKAQPRIFVPRKSFVEQMTTGSSAAVLLRLRSISSTEIVDRRSLAIGCSDMQRD